ncbi:MAG: hypothetical protein K0S74_1426 [Chlamydiales bacterium]|jgi:hypothetical protein|nr:hypothetical protein [Chlamydiales bacterium]
MSPFHNIVNNQIYLSSRERDASQGKKGQRFINNRIAQNILKDSFSSIELSTKLVKPRYGKIARTGDYAATLQGKVTILWDLRLGKKDWESPSDLSFPYTQEELCYQDTLVDDTGLVVQIYDLKTASQNSHTHAKYIETFFKGNRLGSFNCQEGLNHFTLVHGNIFAILHEVEITEDSETKYKATLHSWNKVGEKAEDIPLEGLEKGNIINDIAGSKDYLIISTNSINNPHAIVSLFAFNFAENSFQTFALDSSKPGKYDIRHSVNQYISAKYLSQGYLYLGRYEIESHLFGSRDNFISSKISLLNLTTGKIEKEYSLKLPEAKITDLIIDRQKAFFVACTSASPEYDQLYSLDLINRVERKILDLPRSEGLLKKKSNLSITQNLLTICYADDPSRNGWGSQTRITIDTQTEEIQSHVQYKCLGMPTYSLQSEASDILLIPYVRDGQLTLYLENFNSTYADEHKVDFRIQKFNKDKNAN